ncbi:MAG: HAD hydrolase-like protein [Pseudomonadota bacterium]
MKKEKKNIAFVMDLDGTVVNPGTAIPRCINYALQKQGVKSVPIERLKRYIGHDLTFIFSEVTGRKDKKFLKACIDAYQSRFLKDGIAEHRLYPGIVGLLEAASEKGDLYILSIKPKASCEMVLENLGIVKHFAKIYGGDTKGCKGNKAEILKNLAKTEKLTQIIVVGDRAMDVEAANKCKFRSIGVTYGYGTKNELMNAGASFVAETVGELRQCLLNS